MRGVASEFVIRRLLGEQASVVVVPGSGERSNAMWHVPHHLP